MKRCKNRITPRYDSQSFFVVMKCVTFLSAEMTQDDTVNRGWSRWCLPSVSFMQPPTCSDQVHAVGCTPDMESSQDVTVPAQWGIPSRNHWCQIWLINVQSPSPWVYHDMFGFIDVFTHGDTCRSFSYLFMAHWLNLQLLWRSSDGIPSTWSDGTVAWH